ncbi:MAG: iron-sulfur cluster assembly scaffold protein [Woeseia sp.]
MRNRYSELVRRHFANPVHAGHLPDEYDDAVTGEAAESGPGMRVILSAVADGDTIRLLRYRVFGCPHLIAASEAFCAVTEGKSVSALTAMDVDGLMERLEIPMEKTGRVFILEDAANTLHIALTATTTTED